MDTIEAVKEDLEQMLGLSPSDAELFWALSKKCSALALAPSIAAGAKWGPGLMAAGTMTLPFVGTVSGGTATLLMMGGVWGSSYGACISLLPGLIKLRDELRNNVITLSQAKMEVQRIVTLNRKRSIA